VGPPVLGLVGIEVSSIFGRPDPLASAPHPPEVCSHPATSPLPSTPGAFLGNPPRFRPSENLINNLTPT